MDASLIDIAVFGSLASILGVLLFWFIQLIFIESQKYLLNKIGDQHEAFCRFTNFMGILFQSICHALGYTITRSGIAQFKISVHHAKVSPKKERKGIFEWISNSFLFIGPFFIPSFLVFLIALMIKPFSFSLIEPASLEFYTFGNQLISFGENLFNFSYQFFSLLGTLDLFHPAHLAFLVLLIFFGLGIRPSYIAKEKTTKINMLYDLKNIKSHLFQKPQYVILLFVIAYLFFYISVFFNTNWYTLLFSLFGWLSIIAIIALIIAHFILLFIRYTDEIIRPWRFIPLIIIPLSYIISRLIFLYLHPPYSNGISLLIMCVSTLFVLMILYYYRTNNFKTKTKMNALRVEDGPKRIIRK